MVKLTRPILTFLLALILCLWSWGIGWGIAQALAGSRQTMIPEPTSEPNPAQPQPTATLKIAQSPSPSPSPLSPSPKTAPNPNSTPSETVPSPIPAANIPNLKPIAIDPNKPMFVDAVPTRYEPGFEAYLETCASCHIAIPPEVLPIESWQEILRKPDNHYGTSIPNFNRFTQLLIWDYVSTFSRPSPPDSPRILYVEKSRYFKALHPRVTMPPNMSAKTCVTCHPNVANANFRTLTPEWKDAP
ncbi:MAG: hypothetical protein VKJ02_08815 [Snowella sp.]|nr:hypothetical protein [Snowella sp.]